MMNDDNKSYKHASTQNNNTKLYLLTRIYKCYLAIQKQSLMKCKNISLEKHIK